MSQIHFIGGEKGGVGKSLVARVLAQRIIDQGLPLACFDTDRSHGALLRYYGDQTVATPLDAHDSLDAVLEAATAQPQQQVVVDLAAQTQGAWSTWLSDAGVAEAAAELGVTLSYWHVLDSGRDSVPLLAEWLDGPAGHLPLVVVCNEVRGDRFELLEASGLLDRARERGAQVVRLRKLPDALLQKLDASGSSFWAAQQPGVLGLLDRQRLKLWLQRTHAEWPALAAAA